MNFIFFLSASTADIHNEEYRPLLALGYEFSGTVLSNVDSYVKDFYFMFIHLIHFQGSTHTYSIISG